MGKVDQHLTTVKKSEIGLKKQERLKFLDYFCNSVAVLYQC